MIYLLQEQHNGISETYNKMHCSCRDLGRSIFGEKYGNWAVAPFQWSVLVGLAITYTATAGQSLQVQLLPSCAHHPNR